MWSCIGCVFLCSDCSQNKAVRRCISSAKIMFTTSSEDVGMQILGTVHWIELKHFVNERILYTVMELHFYVTQFSSTIVVKFWGRPFRPMLGVFTFSRTESCLWYSRFGMLWMGAVYSLWWRFNCMMPSSDFKCLKNIQQTYIYYMTSPHNRIPIHPQHSKPWIP